MSDDFADLEHDDDPAGRARLRAMVRVGELVRMRWIGHRLHAELHIAVDPNLTTAESHQIAEELRHSLFHRIPNLAEVVQNLCA